LGILWDKHIKEHAFVEKPGKIVNTQIKRVLTSYFPSLVLNLSNLPDPRLRKDYQIEEIFMSGIGLFLFKEGSRNAFNADRNEPVFRENYRKLFGMRLPHLDTTEDVFRLGNDSDLEQIKVSMISGLIRGKKLDYGKFSGYYIVAVDGTGVTSYDSRHCDCCLQKTSKNGVTTYFHNVLEAKLLTPSGLSISIATEWISNEGKTEFQKQDCEREAFKRLSIKIKKYYPRLPIAIVADGLYPWDGFFEICNKNNWKYIVVLKDGSLKSLQEEISLEKLISSNQNTTITSTEKDKKININYHWINQLQYKKHLINFVECHETVTGIKNKQEVKQRFVHLTNFEVNKQTCNSISFSGRLRQKIENEGFNAQKNHGYALEHKFSRISFNAMKIYYQCLQIAHIINQFVEASLVIKNLKDNISKCTIKYLWKRLLSYLLENEINQDELNALVSKPFQIRLA